MEMKEARAVEIQVSRHALTYGVNFEAVELPLTHPELYEANDNGKPRKVGMRRL